MSYTIEWLVPDRILKAVFPKALNDEVALKYDADLIAYLDAAKAPVHMLVDLRGVQVRPTIKMTGLEHLKHPRLGRVVTIGMTSNPIIRFMASVIGQTLGFHSKDVTSEEEALAYFATVDKND